MESAIGNPAATAAGPSTGAPTTREIARGEGWCVSDVICGLGPQDRPFEERHDHVTIAAVVEGSFLYRSSVGTALLYPGSFLLGNAGTCFECGHDHGAGDRCVAFQFAPSLFEEIAATMAGSHRFRFSTAMLPAIRKLALPVIEAETGARGRGQVAMEELAIGLAEAVLTTLSGGPGTTAVPSSRDQRRVSDVLRHVEKCAGQPLSLADLAGVALMSKYHFLRTFRRTLGITPYQFLLSVRMRRAALALCNSSMPIATVAFDSGFGDLSTFNARFRDVFGMSPHRLRKARKTSSIHGRALPAATSDGVHEEGELLTALPDGVPSVS